MRPVSNPYRRNLSRSLSLPIEACREDDDEWGYGGLENIRHSRYLDQTIYYYGISRCTYTLGEELLLQTFETIGKEALSAALRALQVRPGEETYGRDAEQKIRDTLVSHAPADRMDDFAELYYRLYGVLPENEPSDDHGDDYPKCDSNQY